MKDLTSRLSLAAADALHLDRRNQDDLEFFQYTSITINRILLNIQQIQSLRGHGTRTRALVRLEEKILDDLRRYGTVYGVWRGRKHVFHEVEWATALRGLLASLLLEVRGSGDG